MGAPARTARDGENAAAFYFAANTVGFVVLLWYDAPIFAVATPSDALALAATLAYYGATMAFYMHVRRSDPGFLPQGTAFTTQAHETAPASVADPGPAEAASAGAAGLSELLPPPSAGENEAEDLHQKQEEDKRDKSLTTPTPYRIQKRKPISEQLVTGPNGETYRYCRVCRIWIPLRGRHCKQCSRCVSRYDHHCFWIGVCVGDGNHRKFLAFLFVQSGIFAIAVYQAFTSIASQPTWAAWFLRNWALLATMHTIFGFFLLSLGLAIYHVYLVSVNLTTWEQTRAGDVAYLVDMEDDVLPFDRGCVGNISDYLSRPPRSEYHFEVDAEGRFRRHRFLCCFG